MEYPCILSTEKCTPNFSWIGKVIFLKNQSSFWKKIFPDSNVLFCIKSISCNLMNFFKSNTCFQKSYWLHVTRKHIKFQNALKQVFWQRIKYKQINVTGSPKNYLGNANSSFQAKELSMTYNLIVSQGTCNHRFSDDFRENKND